MSLPSLQYFAHLSASRGGQEWVAAERLSGAWMNWWGRRLSVQHLVRLLIFHFHDARFKVGRNGWHRYDEIHGTCVKMTCLCGKSPAHTLAGAHWLVAFIPRNAADSMISTGRFYLFVAFAGFPAVPHFPPASFPTVG